MHKCGEWRCIILLIETQKNLEAINAFTQDHDMEKNYHYGTLSNKKNDIIWEFFPNIGPPPPPPLLGTPYPKKIFSVYFAF